MAMLRTLLSLAALALGAAALPAADPALPPLVDEPVTGAIAGAWMGQLADATGYRSTVGADGRLDPTIRLSQLPAEAIERIGIAGLGGGLWQHHADGSPTPNWAAALIRNGSQAYILFSTPGQAYPRYDLVLRFAGGREVTVGVDGGPVDANRWTAAYQGAPDWRGGAGRRDLTGERKGPDGWHDDEIRLTALYPGLRVQRVVLTRGSRRWTTGPVRALDDRNADLVDLAPGAASVVFADPDRFDSGRYELEVTYETDAVLRTGVDARRPDAALPVVDAMPPSPAPTDAPAAWLGQDAATGLARIRVDGLPAAIAFAEVADLAGGVWRWTGSPSATLAALMPTTPAGALAVEAGTTLAFLPTSDLRGRTLSVRILAEGAPPVQALGSVVAGATDPAAGQPFPDATTATAQPGDDLAALAGSVGRLVLAPGDHVLSAPLRLTRPIEITGPRSARLRFRQAAGDAAWSRAIEIGAGRTRLSGFSIGCDGPVRFRPESEVSYGSAVVGTVVDRHAPDRRAGLVLDDLAIEGPAATGAWEQAVHLVVMRDSGGGAIRGCDLHGGTVRLLGGPWEVSGNRHRGARAGTWTWDAFACHFAHDVRIVGNELAADRTVLARTWRFLVLTSSGNGITVDGNRVSGTGERPDDAARGIRFENAPETILTESYHTVFEGVPSAISADGRLLRIPGVLAGALGERASVSVLEGPDAGTWHRIRHVVNARECLVDPPMRLAAGALPAIAISDGGFRDAAFTRNVVDLRESTGPLQGRPTALVLAGNHFGTRVEGNRFLGGTPFAIIASPTEHQPFRWGWGYAPVLGLLLADNRCEDGAAAMIGPDHGEPIKGGTGRTYWSGEVRGNVFAWTAEHLAGLAAPPVGIAVGSPLSIDPRETRLRWSGNRGEPAGQAPAPGVARIHAAVVDGTAMHDQVVPLAAADAAPAGGSSQASCGLGGAAAILALAAAAWRALRPATGPSTRAR